MLTTCATVFRLCLWYCQHGIVSISRTVHFHSIWIATAEGEADMAQVALYCCWEARSGVINSNSGHCQIL